MQDAEGGEHEITVPLSKGEKIRLGVNVKVRILKSADGTIENVEVIHADKTPGIGIAVSLGMIVVAGLLLRRKQTLH